MSACSRYCESHLQCNGFSNAPQSHLHLLQAFHTIPILDIVSAEMRAVYDAYDSALGEKIAVLLTDNQFACEVQVRDEDGLTRCVVLVPEDQFERAASLVDERIVRPLDEESKETCPDCGSKSVTTESREFDGTLVQGYIESKCEQCGRTWVR